MSCDSCWAARTLQAHTFEMRRALRCCCSIYDQLNVMPFHIGVTGFYTRQWGREGSFILLWRRRRIRRRSPIRLQYHCRRSPPPRVRGIFFFLLPFRFLAPSWKAFLDGMGQRWVSSLFNTHTHTAARTEKKWRERPRNETKHRKSLCSVRSTIKINK